MNTIGQPSRLQELETKLTFALSLCISFAQFFLNTSVHAIIPFTDQVAEFDVAHFIVVVEDSVDTEIAEFSSCNCEFLKEQSKKKTV